MWRGKAVAWLVGTIVVHALAPRAAAQDTAASPPAAVARAEDVASTYIATAPRVNGPMAPLALPCRLLVQARLQPLVEAGWTGSATFRAQCLELARAGAVVLLQSGTQRDTRWAAESRIGRLPDGRIMAKVRVRDGDETVETIAHELEHVLERIEGRHPAFDAAGTGGGASVAGGAFETRRAQRAGRQVADEVAKARP